MTNKPYLFLQNIAEKREKPFDCFCWVIFKFLLSPKIIIDFLSFCADMKNREKLNSKSNEKGGLRSILGWLYVVVILIIYVILNIVLKKEFGSEILINWVLICVGFNLFILLLINVFAFPSDASAAKLSKELKNEIDKVTQNLFGHKVWAQEKTFMLLDTLLRPNSGKRAKWFLVNFLAHLADERIEYQKISNGSVFVIGTGNNDWPICRYSLFLSQNMTHAEQTILWLIDPNDFFSVLLPEFITYVLASYTINMFGKSPEISFDENTSITVGSAFFRYRNPPNDLKIDGTDWLEIFENILSKETQKKEIDLNPKKTGNEKYDIRWEEFHDKIFKPLVKFGIELISRRSSSLNVQNVCDSFNELSKKYLYRLLPHVLAFGNAQVTEAKRRVLFLGFNMPETQKDEWVKDQINSYLSDENINMWPPYLRNLLNVDIIERAIDLFELTSGGSEILAVGGYRGAEPTPETPTSENYWDIGFYDDQFIVRAAPPKKESNYDIKYKSEPPRRMVQWFYCAPTPEQVTAKPDLWRELPNECSKIALEVLDSAKKGESLSFKEFRRIFSKVIRDKFTPEIKKKK